MMRRRICVLTSVYPTREDPALGAPVWSTLRSFPRDVDFHVHCSLPSAPLLFRLVRPRSYHRYLTGVDDASCSFQAMPLPYSYLPGLTHGSNGDSLARALKLCASREHPDCLLAYRVYPDGYAAVRVAQSLKIPAVICARGSDLKIVSRNARVRASTSYAVKNASLVLCVSEDLARVARDAGLAPERVRVLKNGIDRKTFHPADRVVARQRVGIDINDRIVLYVGSFSRVKNLDLLLDALDVLESQMASIHAVLIGEGNLERHLRARARHLKLRVTFTGPQSPARIAKYLNAADTFVLPSVSEGLPNVAIEALNCGCPVVATRVGGVPELINEHNGILVPPDDTHALAGAIATALSRDWNRTSIAESCARSWDDVARETLHWCDAAQFTEA
jgi:glycosyltransferase involved in cell wall biosynthesis